MEFNSLYSCLQTEMMSDAIDDALDNDEAEDETEDLTNQVLIFSFLFRKKKLGAVGCWIIRFECGADGVN